MTCMAMASMVPLGFELRRRLHRNDDRTSRRNSRSFPAVSGTEYVTPVMFPPWRPSTAGRVQPLANVLRRHGLPPAPERKRTTSWTDFIRTHMDLLAGTDFFTAEVLTLRGLVPRLPRRMTLLLELAGPRLADDERPFIQRPFHPQACDLFTPALEWVWASSSPRPAMSRFNPLQCKSIKCAMRSSVRSFRSQSFGG
jgi:hypothetical protein